MRNVVIVLLAIPLIAAITAVAIVLGLKPADARPPFPAPPPPPPPVPLQVVSHVALEPPVPSDATAVERHDAPAPDDDAALATDAGADMAIDFMKLSDDMLELSERLERFNRKLLEVLAEREARRHAVPDGSGTREQEVE